MRVVEAGTLGLCFGARDDPGSALAATMQLHVDETPWWEAGKGLWLWTASSAETTSYRIDVGRSRAAFDRLPAPLREAIREQFGFILGSDRYSAYSRWPVAQHQHSLAHLLRGLEGAAQWMTSRGCVVTMNRATESMKPNCPPAPPAFQLM